MTFRTPATDDADERNFLSNNKIDFHSSLEQLLLNSYSRSSHVKFSAPGFHHYMHTIVLSYVFLCITLKGSNTVSHKHSRIPLYFNIRRRTETFLKKKKVLSKTQTRDRKKSRQILFLEYRCPMKFYLY